MFAAPEDDCGGDAVGAEEGVCAAVDPICGRSPFVVFTYKRHARDAGPPARGADQADSFKFDAA